VERIAAEPEAVSHVPEVQLPEPVVNLPPNAPAHTIGVQADYNVINSEDFISENTPLTMNNDPLVVPLCNETDLFFSQSLKEQIWGLQYIKVLVCAGALGGKLTSGSGNWTSGTCGTVSGSSAICSTSLWGLSRCT
jgi:hypothetical protein